MNKDNFMAVEDPRRKPEIQFFRDFYPSEHISLTLFGLTVFEFFINKFYDERTLSLTVLGLKVQITWGSNIPPKEKEEK